MRIRLASVLCWILSYAHAGQVDVGAWTQQLLIDTLSASYKDTPSDIEEIQKYYLPYAWGSMHQFLLDKRIEVNERKLILHPKPLTYPRVLATTQCTVSPCWLVSQSFNIPELSLNINLSLQVISGTIVKGNSPFIVQSLSINLNNY